MKGSVWHVSGQMITLRGRYAEDRAIGTADHREPPGLPGPSLPVIAA